MTRRFVLFVTTSLFLALPALGESPSEEKPALPPYLADRGQGIPTSLFGTYVSDGQWLLYSFYEYTSTSQFEYKPSELGFPGERDFLGRLREREALLFVAYGISDRLAVEVEGALSTHASFRKDPDDLSGVPDRLRESGLGDVEAQARWRWLAETAHRPELFSFFEVGFPLQKNEQLIGLQDWEFALGVGVIKGHPWGTLTGRLALAYDGEDSNFDLGEYAVEYLKRVSPVWRFVGALEGESDEVQAILEAQARLGRHVLLKLNSGFGITAKTPDLAPEVGVLFSF